MTDHHDITNWQLHHTRDGRQAEIVVDSCWATVTWPDRPATTAHIRPLDLLSCLGLAGEDPHAWDLLTEGWRLHLPTDRCDPIPRAGSGAEPIRHGGAIRADGTWVLTAGGRQVRHRRSGTVLWSWGVATIWTDDECGLSVIQGLPDGAEWADAGEEETVIAEIGLETFDIRRA